MYDEMAWKYFEKTGDIMAYLEYRKIVENKEAKIYDDMLEEVDIIEDYKDQGNCY